MRRSCLTYYVIKPVIKKQAPSNLFYYEQKGEMYISPNLRLCSSMKMAYIESMELAEIFAEAIMPILQKRYGNDFDLTIGECHTTEDKKTLNKIQADSEIIKKRLESNNYAGNIPP